MNKKKYFEIIINNILLIPLILFYDRYLHNIGICNCIAHSSLHSIAPK